MPRNIASKPLSLWLTLMVCALGIGLPLLWDIPGHWRLIGALQNSGHAVLFFAMAFCLVGRKWPGPWVVLGLCLVGVAIELLQYFIGKDCDLQDVLLDTLGAISGCLAFHAFARRSFIYALLPLGLIAAAFYTPLLIALCYAWQWHNYPKLAAFDEVGRGYLIDQYEGSLYSLTQLPAEFSVPTAPGNATRVLQLKCPVQNWPGVALTDLAPNWQGFNYVQMDVWLADKTAIHLGLALRGQGNLSDHHDVSQRFSLQPGYNRLRWRLEDIKTAAADTNLLTKVDKLIIFCMPEDTRHEVSSLYLDHVVLVH